MLSTIEMKSDLHKLIDNVNDVRILYAIKILLNQPATNTSSVDFWDELPEPVKHDLEIAIKQADKGELLHHKDVMHKIKTKYYSRNGS